MNYLKKLICFLCAIILVATVSGCGTKSPSKVMSEKLDAIKNGDKNTISDILNSEIKNEEETDSQYTDSQNSMVEAVKKITYKVNSEKVDGDSATVNVSVNAPDLADAFSQFIQKAFSDALSSAFSGNTETQEDTDAKYDKIFSEILKNVKFSDRTMDIEMVKEENVWKIKNDNDIIKLVTNIDTDALNNAFDSSDNNINKQ